MADERPQPTIIMTPPAQAGAESSSNPRRPPAHRSVSLLHSPRKRPPPPVERESDSSSSDSAVASRSRATAGSKSDSPSSLQPLGRDSSGESSNAEKWFEQSNNQVRDHSASFADNDPPFFMRNSSSSETPPDAQQQLRQFLAQNGGSADSLNRRAGLLQLGGTDGSSTEDFRSVIDDLTVQNKKLKRRLKKYEKLHDAHLRDEKLFEVRIHGLPPEKKRELEETLQKFAASLNPNNFPVNGYEGLLPVLGKHHTASSATSFQNTDSAYASMSGQGSSAQSGNESRHKHMASTLPSRPQNIHSYLHHIPEGLLPQASPANMTEHAKKKLVARRLEHLFAGKGPAAGGHQHLLQQQEVSQMAARADRVAGEASGQLMRQEGNREAHIMHRGVEDPTDPKQENQNGSPDRLAPPEKAAGNGIKDKSVAKVEENTSSEQRPTRPLDLDPHRAQVPAENLRYMRHLGFSPPDLSSDRSPEEGHGWIYLNLLINMAQLHTINVTTDFVKKALAECSSKFELSEDGRKVRWRGRRSATNTSSSGGGSSSRTNMPTPDAQSPRKRPKLAHRETDKSMTSSVRAGAGSTMRSQSENKLIYTPMFFHKDSTEEDEDSSEDEEEEESISSPYPARAAGDSSGMTSSGVRTTSTKKVKKSNDGPIIFYNNARFCTDLSGDRKVTGNTNAPPYTVASDVPIGKQLSPAEQPYEKRGPLAQASTLPEPMDIDDNPIPESMELSFPPPSPQKADVKSVTSHFPMEVTGIGGTWPADHFAIAVESRRARIDVQEATSVLEDRPSKWVPEKFARVIRSGVTKRKPVKAHKHQIVRINKQDLPPSNLPPAISFMPYGEESPGDDDSELDEEMSASPVSLGAPPPSAAPQPVELHYTSSGEEDEDDDDDDDESDGSLDLLAAAREMDPEAIRAREREYDANMAERLAEEIPAGSSAATAGGGSGFNSPASVRGEDGHSRRIKEARRASVALQRNETLNSVSS